MKLWLFDDPSGESDSLGFLGIPGLRYYPQLLTVQKQREVIKEIDSRPWQNELKRRVQHYGYKYDYKARAINHSMYVGPLPDFAVEIGRQLLILNLIEELPDQLIVNEYLPGQGITAHIDCEPCFKNTIVTVSLGAVYQMDFINASTRDVRGTLLDVGSALILRNEARYEWMHRIQPRKKDRGVLRGRRVSLTFRNVIVCASAMEMEKGEG